MSKLAILQMADEPQIMSSAVQLRSAGYEVMVCGAKLREELLRIGCDTVLSVDSMAHGWGYDALDPNIGQAALWDVERCDLFVEIKVRNLEKIWSRWPRLRDKTLWWRVNGAQPEICPKGGDEVNLTCPIVTACLWYGAPRYRQDKNEPPPQQDASVHEHGANKPVTLEQLVRTCIHAPPGDHGLAYTMWPPYPRSQDYDAIDREGLNSFTNPYCICHNVRGWGYGAIIDDCVKLGVDIFGNNAPAGLIRHEQVPSIVATAMALVHLKSVDCPGWALYEALLGGCPVIAGRLLNSRMLAYDLLMNGRTCLEFGVPASLEYGRGDLQPEKCLEDIKIALEKLADPETNYRIGQAGRKRLRELMWREDRDGDSFRGFMQRWFP